MLSTAPLPDRLPADTRLSRWRAPDGWDHRRLDLTGGGRGRVLVQGGRADVLEKYLDVALHLRAQGWGITSFDWRGQGGSGRLGIGNAGHLDDFALLEDDLAAFWRAWSVEATGRCVLVTHSMGGHVALRAAAAGRIDPAAMVLSAPMVLVRSPLGQALGGKVARSMVARRGAGGEAWGKGETPAALERRFRRLTVDNSRGQDSRWWHDGSALALGSPSWGWLAAAFRSGAALRADPRLASIRVPTLFLVPERDRLVDARATLALAARMPAAEVVRFGLEAGHEVLREGVAVRDRAFAAIDRFLNREVPA